MGNVWRLVIRPDRSVCVAKRHIEDETIVEIIPRRPPTHEKGVVSSLCTLQFLCLITFSGKNLIQAWLMFINLGFTLVVMYYISIIHVMLIHSIYTFALLGYGIIMSDIYMMIMASTYNIVYGYYIIKDIIRD